MLEEPAQDTEAAEAAEGGEAACWAHLVCPECGAIVTEGHAAGCSFGAAGPPAP